MKRQPVAKHDPSAPTDARRDPILGHRNRSRSNARMTGSGGPAATAGARNPLVPLLRKRKAGTHEDRREKARLRRDQREMASVGRGSRDEA